LGLEPGPEPLSPGLQHPREGQKLVKLEGARQRRPATSGTHGAPRDAGTIQLPPLSPSGPVRTQVILAENALAGAGRLRHTALRWRVQTPRTRRRTAAPAERLPPGVLMERMASGQRSTDSISAGGQGAPGLRPPQRSSPCFAPVRDPVAHQTPFTAGVTGALPEERSEHRRDQG